MKTIIKNLALIMALFVSTVAFAQVAGAATPVPATVGQTITITANASSGTTPFVFTWLKNDAKWTPPAAPVISADGRTAVVTITNVQLTDAGNYSVTIANSLGSITPAAALTVAQMIILPGNASLTITAK